MNEQLRKLLLTVIPATIGAAIFLGGYVWLYRFAASLRRELAAFDEKLIVFENTRKDAKRADLFFEERRDEIARVKKFFIDPANPLNFIEDLESLARTLNASLTIGLDEKRNSSAAKEFYFRITVEDTEHGLRRYLALLEHMPYALKTEELFFEKLNREGLYVQVTKGKEKKVVPTHRATILLSVKTSP